MNAETIDCRQEGCHVAEDGRCLEALENPAECPHFIAAGIEGEREVGGPADEQAEAPAEEAVGWQSGKALEAVEANELLAEEGGEIVVIAGEAESGKTTLLTVLFALLRASRLGPYSFSGSSTLLGFERRAFFASTSSFSSEEDTERTRNITDEGELLHLMLRIQEEEKEVNRCLQVFLTDIPGEKFEKVRHNTAAAESVGLLRHADKLLILADGERVAGDEYQTAGAEVRQLLGAILASEMLPEDVEIGLVLTKFDWMVEGIEAGSREAAFWAKEREILATNCERSGYSLRFFETAARASRSDKIEAGHGLVDLARWMIEPPEAEPPRRARPLAGATRSFDLP